MSPLRVVLVDDHSLVRSGIRSLLEKTAEIEVVGEASSSSDALKLIAEIQPDVVLMDIALPGQNGLETMTRVTKQFPQVRVIMLSMHANEEYVWQAIQNGASGYLMKDANSAELVAAITAVARGESYLSPTVSKHVTEYIRRAGQEQSSVGRLTPRQREILQLIAQGNTTQQIAQKLTLSVKTVETHRAQLMERLGIRDIAGLVRYAIRSGLVTSNE
jgi:DNA-binding NarL/FixJ family response regulator